MSHSTIKFGVFLPANYRKLREVNNFSHFYIFTWKDEQFIAENILNLSEKFKID